MCLTLIICIPLILQFRKGLQFFSKINLNPSYYAENVNLIENSKFVIKCIYISGCIVYMVLVIIHIYLPVIRIPYGSIPDG